MFKNIYVYLSKENFDACDLDAFCEVASNAKADVRWILKENDLKEILQQLNQDNSEEKHLLITDTNLDLGENVCVTGYGLDFKGDVPFVIENLSGVTCKFIELVYARFVDEPYTVFETDRLVAREMTVEDLPGLYELYDTVSDCPYVEPLYEYEEEKAFTINYINNMYKFFWYGLWLIFDKQSGRLVGRAGLENREIDGHTRVELGYMIGKPWQGKGYGLEVSRAIIDYARDELEIGHLYVCTDKNNKPSISLAAKLGFAEYAGDIDGMNLYYKKL